MTEWRGRFANESMHLGEKIHLIYMETNGINPKNGNGWNPTEMLQELRDRKLVNEYCNVLDVAEEGDRVLGGR